MSSIGDLCPLPTRPDKKIDQRHSAENIVYLLIAASGIGCLFQTPLIGLQAAMPIKDMATSTSTFGFIRWVTHLHVAELFVLI